ncbi:hypothetical protein SmJEL517_g00317 [Synchytrium microbalum]|uniref:PAS domain-containing protein n=1 Tax=Synchytrium microbalum TaxID=1806994 RepID=A0A507CIT4_9FUNG|nr:uncharacterized protein SmJEL517_g00317 [Synchytrium microbalum]TPX38074.1 hypothetical protein SmJEL517_g00317 [Synchytrium microbalum]
MSSNLTSLLEPSPFATAVSSPIIKAHNQGQEVFLKQWVDSKLSHMERNVVETRQQPSMLQDRPLPPPPKRQKTMSSTPADMRSSAFPAMQMTATNPMESYFLRPPGQQPMAFPTSGLYSSSGIDMIGILSRVAHRPNPVIDLGPVDLSSSFLVVDAKKADMPIVYASESFERLTGYSGQEIMGKNCRFLQSPDGLVEKGSIRRFVDNSVVQQLKSSIENRQECQYININYKKSGEPFVNLITVVPIDLGSGETSYFVGFQVDMMQQSRAILRRLEDGSYVIDFNSKEQHESAHPIPSASSTTAPMPSIPQPPQMMRNVQQQAPLQTMPDLGKSTGMRPYSSNPFQIPTSPDDIPDLFGQSSPSFIGGSTTSGRTPSVDENMTSGATIAAASSGMGQQEEDEQQQPPDFDFDVESIAEHEPSAYPEGTIDPETLSHYNLVQNGPDFIHILSSRGIILFASPASCKDMFDFEAGELIGRNIDKFCHPGDLISLMRELKFSTLNGNISAIYRFRKRIGGYVWVEITGHKYEMKNRKKTKCFVLSGRQRTTGELSQRELALDWTPSSVLTGDLPLSDRGSLPIKSDIWAKMSVEGFFLYISSTSDSQILKGATPSQLYGTRLVDLVDPTERDMVSEYLESTSTQSVGCEFTAHIIPCEISSAIKVTEAVAVSIGLYPACITDDPAFIFCRISGYSSVDERPSWGMMVSNTNIFDDVALDQSSSLQFELNQLKMSNKRIVEELNKFGVHVETGITQSKSV